MTIELTCAPPSASYDVRHEVLCGRALGEFILGERIDEGGCGAVYRARQDGLARPCVVKVLHQRAPTGDATLQRLVREAQLACRVDHPYAVHVYAFGVEDDGLLWIAMELVDGCSLEEWLGEHGPMPLGVFVPFFERVAQVVQAAHEHGVVHRDIKPSNIMVIEQPGGELLPKLLDFGVAKLVDDITGREGPPDQAGDDTPEGFMWGSPSYAAPEQWSESQHIGPAADIYALGVLAFEALTGRRPYRADGVNALGLLHCEGAIPPGPEPIRRALAKEPTDRPSTPLELATALREEAAREQRRRRRQRVLTAAALAAVALLGVAIQGYAMHATRMAQQRAADAEHEARATELTAEVEQGRAALLAGDYTGAQRHLGEAWRRGDHSWSTRFMLDRAEQPLRAELARLPATRGRMWSASWSPDGALIATSDDAGAQIWDGTTYAQLSPLPHEDVVYAAVWMSATRLVTACGDGSVRIWDAARGDLVKELRIRGKRPRWYVVAVSGDRVAAVDAKGQVAAVWDAGGAVLTELPLTGDGWPSVAFSADGRWLAVSGGGAAEVVDAATGARGPQVGEQVRAIAWDPGGTRLLVGSSSGEAMLWIPAGGEARITQLGEAVTAVAWSLDSARIAVAGEDGTEQVIDAGTGRVVARGNYLRARIASLAFSADGRRIVSAGAAGEMAIGDAASGLPVEMLGGPRQQLGSVSFGRTGLRVLAASWDGTARIWDAQPPYRQWSAGRLSGGFGLFGGVEPDGRYMAVQCPGCATRVWDTAQDRLLAELPVVAETRSDTPVPFPTASVDRAAVARGNTAEVYALPGGTLVDVAHHDAPVTALAFGTGRALVSGDATGVVLETSNGHTTRMSSGMGDEIAAIVALPGGQIAAADAGGRVQFLSSTGARTVTFGSAGIRVRMLRGSPDGLRLLLVPFHAGKTMPMTLIDVEHGATLAKLDGPPVYAARWVSGYILSAHADGSARMWSADGKLLRTYIGGARFLADADLSPDGSLVVGGGGDGLLRFWDTETGKPLWVVAAHKPYVMGVHFEDGDIVTRGAGGEVARWHIPAWDAAFSGAK